MRKVFLFFLMAMVFQCSAWAVDTISFATEATANYAPEGDEHGWDFYAYEKEVFDTGTDRWYYYELGAEVGRSLTDKWSVLGGMEYYQTRGSVLDSSLTYFQLAHKTFDFMTLKAQYRYHWSEEGADYDQMKYGPVFSFDLPWDISFDDCNYIYSNLRNNSHSYLNEFDLTKKLYTWGDDKTLNFLFGEEISYSFETDLLEYAATSAGLSFAFGSATAKVEYYLTDNYHNPYDSERIEFCFAWDF